MKLDDTAHKEEFDLNEIAYYRVKSSGIVSFRLITMDLGRIFHLTRKQTFQILKTWQRKGWVKIYPFHGAEFLK